MEVRADFNIMHACVSGDTDININTTHMNIVCVMRVRWTEIAVWF